MPPLGTLLTPAAYWFPESLVASAWHQHAPFAFWIVDVHRPRLLVELGTHHGFSYLAFCQAIERLGLDTKAFAIDHWRGDEQAGFFGDEVLERLRDHHDPRYGRFSRLLQSSFDDAVGDFADGAIDLLHIDGAHQLHSVRNDFEKWLPKMSARGVMLFHDTRVRRGGFGVRQLWQELAARYPHFEFKHGHGLGVLGVGAESPASLGMLFSQGGSEAKATRAAFARLGKAVTRATPVMPRLLTRVAHWMPHSLRRGLLRLPGAARLQRGMAGSHRPAGSRRGRGPTGPGA